MSTQQELEGYATALTYSGRARQPINADGYGGLYVSQNMPRGYSMARAGRLFVGTTGTATAVAPVAAIPTTAAAWALYNGNATTTKRYLFPIGVSYWSVSGTNGLGSQLLVGISPTIQGSALVTATNGFVKSTNPGSSVTTSATFATGATLAGTPAWLALEGALNVSSILVGGGRYVSVEGMYAIPPGFALGITVLGPAGTSAAFGASVLFADIECDI